MTDQTNNETVQDSTEEFYSEAIEKDGLCVAVNEETNEITFSWNPDTHPQWNYLEEVDREELIRLMYRQFEIETEATKQEEAQ